MFARQTRIGQHCRYENFIVIRAPIPYSNKLQKTDLSNGQVNVGPPPVAENKPPLPFTISLVDSSGHTASISWTQAVDPDGDPLSYNLYLNDTLKVENYALLKYTFTDLKELSSYTVKIVALDSAQKQTVSLLNFTTPKYWLKFLNKVEYGLNDGYTSKRTGQMIKANDGGYIIVGNVAVSLGLNATHKMVAIKIDTLGNKVWEQLYDYNAGDYKIKVTSKQ